MQSESHPSRSSSPAATATAAKPAKPRTWAELKPTGRATIPEGLWLRCPGCSQMIYRRQMEANLNVCPECDHHFRMGAVGRVEQLADPGCFVPLNKGMIACDPLKFTDVKSYKDRLRAQWKLTGKRDAVLAGTAFIKGRPVVLACLDLEFMMGSMGSVVGEQLTLAIETATERAEPLIIVSASGGARMQESSLSLMQMAKTSAALARLDDKGGLFISLLT
ncbi:MAG: acetyl-CoA carboxylase carboxyltransferase subunit beta, partial [Planctomycetota bacterium]